LTDGVEHHADAEPDQQEPWGERPRAGRAFHEREEDDDSDGRRAEPGHDEVALREAFGSCR
jgi:hypothetical protein